MGIAFGLTAALAWGVSDVLAALASRRTGAFRVVLGFHLVAMALLAALILATGEGVSGVSAGDLAWLAFVGVLGGVSYLAFYRALAIGPISIVSPIVSAYAAVTVVCAVLIGGERPGTGEIAAIVVVIAGVLLASSDLTQMRALERIALLGIVLALVTAVVIGAFVYGIAYFSDEQGWLVPIFLARLLDSLPPRDLAARRRVALPRPLARPARAHRGDRPDRHRRLRPLQRRRPPHRHLGRRHRRGSLRGRADRGRRRPPRRAPEAHPVGGHRPRGRRPRRPRPERLGGFGEIPSVPPGRAARPDAVSSVAPVASGYERSLRPCLGTTIAPRRRALFRQSLLARPSDTV